MLAAKVQAPQAKKATPAEQSNHSAQALRQTTFNSIWASLALGIQPKLAISAADDTLEREADRVADHVMRMPDLHLPTTQPQISRKCDACEEKEKLQKKSATPQAATSQAPAVVHDVLRSPGQPLDAATQSHLEPHFGHDFSRVRVNTDTPTAASARDLNAKAYTLGSRIGRAPLQCAPHTTLPGVTGEGVPLPRAARDYLEPRFARSFDHVRIHTGDDAAVAAQSLAARAFTLGSNIVFGRGEFAPDTGDGRRLLAHELTHVIQQGESGPRIARAPLDLSRLDSELKAGGPLTQTAGDIGFGSARGKPLDAPAEDTTLPIGAFVFPRTSTSPMAKSPPAAPLPSVAPPAGVDVVSGAAPLLPCAREQYATTICKDDARCLQARQAYLECVDEKRPALARPPAGAGSTATPPSSPAPRALVIGSIHGDELGPQALSLRLLIELSQDLFRRDFDTIFVPLMNPGGALDEMRTPGTGRNNRHQVDLNRNWPGLPGYKAFLGTPPPMQPEVKAVKAVIDKLQPSRILSMHAQGDPAKGGAFADPVEGEAREIACRMAMAIGGGDTNDPANRLSKQVCGSRYPAAAEVEISEKQSSLGAWASVALKTPVVTTEVPSKAKLPETGADRSVENIMPGLRDFFRVHTGEPSKPDELLRKAITTTLLTGMPTAADTGLLSAIEQIVEARFQDMRTFYKDAWLPKHTAGKPPPPAALKKSQTRSFTVQAGIDLGELAKRKITKTSAEADVRKALLDILGTMSMAGFSRHHWGTEIDLMGPDEVKHEFWEGSGKFVSLIPFVRDHAAQFGFFNPYSGGAARATPHYNDEPWHLSYWPIANVIEEQWLTQIQGKVLDDMIDKTADAIRGPIDKTLMMRVLKSLQLEKYQAHVAKI
jgi:predicted deacylase